MKRRDLIKRINQIAKDADASWEFIAEGGNHEVWAINGRRITIPRHNEINEITAGSIIKAARRVISGEDRPR